MSLCFDDKEPPKPTELGLALRAARLNLGIRLFDMALSLGLSSAHLSGLEYGKKKVRRKTADIIINLYGIDAELVTPLIGGNLDG